MFTSPRVKYLIVLLAASLLPVTLQARDSYLFDKLVLDTGSQPTAIAVGDFNRDGRLDIVTANQLGNNVSVLLGKADGTFVTKKDYAVGAGPSSVTVGDFNGDGILDIAVTNATANTVSILLGNGAGGFKTHADFAVGSRPESVAIADLNGDGKLDLVTSNSAANTISVLLGTGTGSFGAHTDFATGTQPKSVTLGDFNGDHKLDAAVANRSSNTVSVLLGNGSGGFGAKTDFTAGTHPVSVAVGDMNRDGKQDIMVAQDYGKNQISNAGVLLGKDDGTFQPIVQYAIGSSPSQVIVADLNGDGIPDVVTTAKNATSTIFLLTGGVSVLLGKGDGTFGTQLPYATGTGCAAVASGDINRDGLMDLIAANPMDNSATVLLGVGGGKFTSTSVISSTVSSGIGHGDFNHDTLPDLVTVDGLSTLSVFTNNGAGSFFGGVNYAAGETPAQLAVGDFNGDGNPDVAVLDANGNNVGSVMIFLGNIDGSLTAHATYSTGEVPEAIVAADFNQDGILDLAFTNLDSFNLEVMFGNGDGTFQNPVKYPVKNGVQPVGLVAVDLNNDHFPDLAFSLNFEPYISVLLNDGTGHFGPEVHYTTVEGYSIAAGDVNQDGNMDLMLGTNGDSKISLLLGNGDGTFQPQQKLDYGGQASVSDIKVADMDGDGIQDIAVGVADFFTVLRGNGDGTFKTHDDFFMPRPSVVGITVADLTTIGALDAALGGSDGTMILRNPPVIALDPNPLSFAAQTVGTTSGAKTVTVSSSGVASLAIRSIALGGVNAGDFTLTNNCAGATITGGAACAITLRFTPQATGARAAMVQISTAAQTAPYVVSVTGSGK